MEVSSLFARFYIGEALHEVLLKGCERMIEKDTVGRRGCLGNLRLRSLPSRNFCKQKHVDKKMAGNSSKRLIY